MNGDSKKPLDALSQARLIDEQILQHLNNLGKREEEKYLPIWKMIKKNLERIPTISDQIAYLKKERSEYKAELSEESFNASGETVLRLGPGPLYLERRINEKIDYLEKQLKESQYPSLRKIIKPEYYGLCIRVYNELTGGIPLTKGKGYILFATIAAINDSTKPKLLQNSDLHDNDLLKAFEREYPNNPKFARVKRNKTKPGHKETGFDHYLAKAYEIIRQAE